MITVRLPKELEDQLERIAQETNRSKSYYVRTALEQYLEDRKDYLLAIAKLEKSNPRISYELVRKELGLKDDLEN
jgi:RHH-type transcriptional regulator, rel operon repressor / antitoxin RelB